MSDDDRFIRRGMVIRDRRRQSGTPADRHSPPARAPMIWSDDDAMSYPQRWIIRIIAGLFAAALGFLLAWLLLTPAELIR